jgi:hypothetical protein
MLGKKTDGLLENLWILKLILNPQIFQQTISLFPEHSTLESKVCQLLRFFLFRVLVSDLELYENILSLWCPQKWTEHFK